MGTRRDRRRGSVGEPRGGRLGRDERTAFHEAGHAVVAVALEGAWGLRLLSVTIEGDDGQPEIHWGAPAWTEGCTLIRQRLDRDWEFAQMQLRDQLVFNCAGIAAEARAGGRKSPNAHDYLGALGDWGLAKPILAD